MAIQDLNIINTNEGTYNVTLHFMDGTIMEAKQCRLDLFNGDEKARIVLRDNNGREAVIVGFNPLSCSYDEVRHATVIPAEKLSVDCTDYYGEEVKAETQKLIPKYLSIVRAAERNIHYLTA